jgi:dephospho-CoA kinase
VNAPRLPYCVGLTGGIGSGKSTVAAHFVRLGADLIDTDAIARELTAPGGAALPALCANFGTDILSADGALDRAAMRQRVFTDTDARRRLEAILHPRIRETALARAQASQAAYVLFDVPLLTESVDWQSRCDRILVVDCPPERQIRRVMARSGLTQTEVERILASQASRTERLAIADDVIDNSGDLARLEAQIPPLHRHYLHAALARQAAK